MATVDVLSTSQGRPAADASLKWRSWIKLFVFAILIIVCYLKYIKYLRIFTLNTANYIATHADIHCSFIH